MIPSTNPKPLLGFSVQEPEYTDPRSLILYGAPKCGKTSSAIKLPNHYVFRVENGAETHRCMRSDKIDTYPQFMVACQKVIDAGCPFKYPVFDSLTEIEKLCQAQALIDYKSSPIGKNFIGDDVCRGLDKGAGYIWLRDAFNKCYAMAMKTVPPGGCAVFIGHLRESQLKDGKELNEVSSYSIALTAGCALIACSKTNAIGHLTRRTRPRPTGMGPIVDDLWVSFKTTALVNCGSVHAHLAGKEFVFSDSETHTPRWDLIFPSNPEILPPAQATK